MSIEGAGDRQATAIEDVGTDPGSYHVLAAEEFPDRTDTCPGRKRWVA
jgi:hypothetical protein